MSELNSMATAPKDGTIVLLTSAEYGITKAMSFSKRLGKWIGKEFTPMGSVRTYWDMSVVQPDGWMTVAKA